MSTCSRRDFLVRTAVAGAAVWQADQLLAVGDTASGTPVDMTIARWKGSQPKDPKDANLADIASRLTQQAIDGLGGMQRFVKRGDVVWIKANIAWDRTPEQAGNTNPQVIATLVKMCLEAGAKTVKVGDNAVHSAAKTYAASGIAGAVKPVDGQMVYLDKQRFKQTAIHGERIKTLLLYPDILESDLVINVPIVKHHQLTNATLCMKNYMGVMDNRQPLHQDLATCLTDLTRFMKPRLCVLDAVRLLNDHGPTGGKLEDVVVKTTVAAGVDIVALDAFGLELMGKDPGETKKATAIVKYAHEAGLGKMDYRSLALKELAVS